MGEALGRSASAALLEIRSALGRARDRWRMVSFAENALKWGAVLLGTILFVSAAEALLRPGVALRLLLSAALACAAAFGLIFGIIRPLGRRFRDEAVARRVETAFGGLQNALINAIELGEAEHPGPSAELVEAAIVQSGQRVGEISPEKAIDTSGVAPQAKYGAAVFAASVLAFALFGGRLSSALMQVITPLSFVPSQGSVRILSVSPGNTVVRSGARVPVEVTIGAHAGSTPEGVLYQCLAGGDEIERRLTPADRTHYVCALTATARMTYRVEIGRTESRIYTVEVKERPAIERVDIELRYPEFTGLEAMKIAGASDAQLDIRAPAGTVVAFAVTTSRPVKAAFVEIDAGQSHERVSLEVAGTGQTACGAVHLAEPCDRRYAIRLVDEAGESDDSPVWHELVALADEPPKLTFVAPAKRIELSPGASVSLVIRARDDFGLMRVELRQRRNKEGEDRTFHAWTSDQIPTRTDAALTYRWKLDASSFAVGDVVTYWALGVDRLPDRVGESRRWEIRIVKAELKAKRTQAVLEALLRAIGEMVRMQEAAQKEGRQIAARGARGGSWRPVASAQSQLRAKAAAAIGSAAAASESDVVIVRAVLRRLADGEMANAIIMAERLAAGATDAKPTALDESQTSVLEQLRRLLGALPRAIEVAKKKELEEEEGSDLPDETTDKLRDLADQLKKFADEQRKVIADTQDLAKIPTEDFTDADKAKEEALAAIEEKWEKFLKEFASDLSKLPKQDFSNEQLLKELIEVYSEVEMAKDSLKQGAKEIAVPMEQAGLELAEELTTHIEKWLPDTPDRDKWSMEQPLGEYETPSAELPTELEDIIGELMEEEEDTFDEMEDVTSSWMDSLDKGAGWDTLDGPISNMSAQGVTGNRLPNSSEIGGRSGEGRTGKASGEMVEDTATGKGGRRTPTRLTPDAFLGGEIKDVSKDPAGGATGGGKLSGAGGEGLEGPPPPDVEREMERLKGAQASLRNKAERIAMQLRARDFPAADIDLTLRSLRALEADLKDGRYTNLSRRRNILLEGLGRSREFLEGTAEVQVDRSRGPDGLDEEVGSARDEVDPAGYEALLRAYREALRSGGR